MDFHANQAVVADVRTNRSSVPTSRKLTVCVEELLGDRGAHVTQLLADLNLRPLLVEAHQPRRRDDVRIADRFERVDEQRQVGVEIAELEAPFGHVNRGEIRERTARNEAGIVVRAEGFEIDAELEFVRELDAQDHRLDGDLRRPAIDIDEDLIELLEDRFVVADDHDIGSCQVVAAGFVLDRRGCRPRPVRRR